MRKRVVKVVRMIKTSEEKHENNWEGIRYMSAEEIPECVNVIIESFKTVADEFGVTPENAPRYVGFATDEKRLHWHFENEQRPMIVYIKDNHIVGYYSLALQNDSECELNNLCVLPEYRHEGIGEKLLADCFEKVKELGCSKVKIGILEENVVIRKWYEKYGFVHTGTQKFDFFPFTCGYMERII